MKILTWRSVARLSVIIMLGMICSGVFSQSNEAKVGIDDVPAPVRNAILETVGTGRLVDIGEFTADGKVVHYEIEMIIDGEENTDSCGLS